MSNLDRVGVFSRVKYFREKAGLTVYQLSMKAGFYSENGNMASRSISRLEAAEDARDKQQKESGFAENKNVVNVKHFENKIKLKTPIKEAIITSYNYFSKDINENLVNAIPKNKGFTTN